MKLIALIPFVFLLGCENLPFKTREQLRKPNAGKAESTRDKAKDEAPAPPTQEEHEDQLRQFNGRIEELESQIAAMKSNQAAEKAAKDKEKQALEDRLLAIEEALKKADGQIQELVEKVANPKPSISGDPVVQGDERMAAQDYNRAILAFEEYRKTKPKGDRFAEVTLKIAQCYQELGMKDVSETYYEEVISRFPKSAEAKKARASLKTLKKKK